MSLPSKSLGRFMRSRILTGVRAKDGVMTRKEKAATSSQPKAVTSLRWADVKELSTLFESPERGDRLSDHNRVWLRYAARLLSSFLGSPASAPVPPAAELAFEISDLLLI